MIINIFLSCRKVQNVCKLFVPKLLLGCFRNIYTFYFVFFIILFMMTPLNTFLLSSIFGKVIILTLLGYTLYYNVYSTNKFANTFNISLTSDSWNTIKIQQYIKKINYAI